MLAYRHGTYATFVERMLATIQTQVVPDPSVGRPLAGIHLSSTDDLVVGILRAWAATADVLTFYQERIANEGFLRTARDPRSVTELAHTVGYQPRQALAASTWLAFTIGAGPGIARELLVPAGTRVQSLPGPGERPQVFETIESLPMRAEWNDLRPLPAEAGPPAPIQPGSTQLVLDGSNLRLSDGDLLLILDEATYKPPIQHMIWGTELPTSAHGVWPTLTKVERLAAAGRTRVSWQQPISGPPLARPAVFVFRKRARFFGFDAAAWASLSDDRRRQLAPTVDGLAYSADGGQHWSAAAERPTSRDVRALLVQAAGRVFAATGGDGVLRSVDGGANWQAVNAGLVRKDVHALIADGQGGLYAGTSGGGVWQSLDGGDSWSPLRTDNSVRVGGQGLTVSSTRLPNTVVRALGVSGANLVAATDAGLFRFTLGGSGWTPAAGGLPPTAHPSCIVVGDGGSPVVIGTDQGVFVSTNLTANWAAASGGLPERAPVRALARLVGPDGQRALLVAATDQGVFVSPLQATPSWSRVVAPDGEVSALAASGTTLYAGTSRGVFRSTDAAATWQPVTMGLSGQPIQALGVASDDADRLVAAEMLSSAPGDQWPGFAIAPDVVDLDATYPAVQSGGWFIVTQPGMSSIGLFPVLQATRVLRTAFGERGFVTSVATHPDPQLPTFDRRTAVVHVGSEALTIAVDPLGIVASADLVLASALVEPLPSSRAIAISGKRPRGRLAPAVQGSPVLVSDDGREHIGLLPGELVEVLAAPVSLAAGGVRWRLRHHSGLEGSITLQPDELAWAASDADSEQVSEIGHVAAVTADDGSGHAHLTLARAPANVYDAATVHLNGNVALATHGESVREVLGSGDYTATHQQFTLKKAPLTRYLLAGQVEPTSTLAVWVNQVRWQPVDTLIDLDEHGHAYSVTTADDGSVRVVFGDGTHGARLPSGTENVIATYRTGAGLAGEVRAASLAQLLTRPLGVRSVTNPLAASGAAEAESSDAIREHAPQSLLRRSRIVSLPDYATFATGYPDVAEADVRILQVGRASLVHVTVASRPGSAGVDPEALLQSIMAAQATPRPVVVAPATLVPFRVGVCIQPDPARLVDDLTAAVVVVVRTALLDAFALPRRRLVQPVSAAEVVEVAQLVPGVLAVDLQTLEVATAESGGPGPGSLLSARPAHVDPASGQVVAGEVLVLDAVHLTVETRA